MHSKPAILLAGVLALAPALAQTETQHSHWGTRWQRLPATPAPVAGMQTGYAGVNGIQLYYATMGKGAPVILLHGGLANSDYWGLQVVELAKHYQVIVVDSRGHGRSTHNAQPYGYDLMTDDIIALMDRLHLPTAAIVGWSDGAIVGLDMAMRYPQRVSKVFAFAPNTTTQGVKPGVEQNPLFAAYLSRAAEEYKKLSATPDDWQNIVRQISQMWQSQPEWRDEDLRNIGAQVMIADGDHDEAIDRNHLEHIAATIPDAGLLILPTVSHFAFLQAPQEFTDAVLHFLDDK
ncbi:alpha/beta hydrolase [Mixta theicola]|uniref:Alpha/beta hydrolase n=1 Tax=Mixta theicola TaxID=1458355 RepID=A0A2K1QCW1_9GAMM|nr:alpha/beta hydrolase [Mixta theicola]PNS12864.1 alpha/beta hydrolase [Mixta theicola]GLR09111.1 oxidoreductase [Mixta theicola]